MRLKKLEMYGFKSFAQRTEIVFHDGITGIVGPNGSGKSNIGDAVRWVLGEQSAKSLRGASMADVIFGGTQKRKPLSYCEVSLIFDNEDRALPVDFAEVMITRRVYRNGESEYYINRSACRLRDMIDLFRDTGIGREGYSIIGQGRIDEILSRKSEDRRQVFEEAAGITKFKARKEEADKKLEKTLENASRVDDILLELTRRLKPLEKEAEDARTYLALSEKMKTLDLGLFVLQSDTLREKIKQMENDVTVLKVLVGDQEKWIGEKTEQRHALQEKIDEMEQRLTLIRQALTEKTEESAALREQEAALQGRMTERQESHRRTLKDMEDEETRRQGLLQEKENLTQAVQAGEAEAQKSGSILQAAEEKARQQEEKTAALSQAFEDHQQQMMHFFNRRSAMQNDFTRLKTMQAQMEQRLSEVEEETAELFQKGEELQNGLREAAESLQKEKDATASKEQSLQAFRQILMEKDRQVIELRTESERFSMAVQEKTSRQRLLSDFSREMEGYSQTVRRAISYARERKITGVKGVLAQLIEVPKQYETALDMVLGAAQQNIVTDHEETARVIIDYLRQNKCGRATFLPMTTVKPRLLSEREKEVLSMKGCLGVAADMVKCDSAYRGIIENLLGRTIIADTLENGISIMRAGRHAFRLVTLAGDVMHSGGSMTGGSGQSRMVNLFAREREMKELTVTLQQDQEKLSQMQKALEDRQKEKAVARDRVGQAAESLHAQEIALARETEHYSACQEAFSAHQTLMEQREGAAQQLKDALTEIETQLTDVERKDQEEGQTPETMEQQSAQLQKELRLSREESEKAREEVMHLSLRKQEKTHQLDTLHRAMERLLQDEKALEETQQGRQSLLRQFENQQEKDQQALQETQSSLQAMDSALRTIEGEQQALEGQRTQVQQQFQTLTQEVESLHQAAGQDVEKLHRAEMVLQKTETESHQLENRMWDMYEVTYEGAEPYRPAVDFDIRQAERDAAHMAAQIRAMGPVNVRAVEEYAETRQRHDELETQLNDLRKAEGDLRELIDRLIHEMETTFVENFSKIQVYFSETFTRLFGGGHAELKLLDPSDPLGCGIEVNVQPPGKKLQLLSLLSGGERALCAIALLLAMLKLKPSPFCILDEIEAALDDANIGYYADYLKEYSKASQFIVVTHRKGTMERCDALYGVAMEEQGVSKMVSVKLQDYNE